MKNSKSLEFEERFLKFGVDVIKTITPRKEVPRSVMDQAIRAATSIGANYAEAQNAASKADFKNKVFIAKKEAAEARYWLRVIAELTEPELVNELLTESQEILLILQKTINTLRSPK